MLLAHEAMEQASPSDPGSGEATKIHGEAKRRKIPKHQTMKKYPRGAANEDGATSTLMPV